MAAERQSRIWRFLRGLFFFGFGLLAVCLSAFIFAWLLHNVFSESPDEGFLKSLGPGTLFPLVHLIAGFVSCLVMGFTGMVWIRKSGAGVVMRRMVRRR
jgi:hypothetical protein